MQEAIIALDSSVVVLMSSMQTPLLTALMHLVTQAGNIILVACVVAACASYYAFNGKFRVALVIIAVFIGVALSVALLKLMIARPRPELALFTEHFSSFPSMHAALAVAVYGLIARVAVLRVQTDASQFFFGVGGLLLIFLVSVSRLYLGVHYLSDVGAGMLIGLAWFLLGMHLLSPLRERWTGRRAPV